MSHHITPCQDTQEKKAWTRDIAINQSKFFLKDRSYHSISSHLNDHRRTWRQGSWLAVLRASNSRNAKSRGKTLTSKQRQTTTQKQGQKMILSYLQWILSKALWVGSIPWFRCVVFRMKNVQLRVKYDFRKLKSRIHKMKKDKKTWICLSLVVGVHGICRWV